MTLAAKAAAATLGTGGVVTLGCYVCGAFGGSEWHSLVEETSGTTTDNYANKVGARDKYGRFLTGVTNSANEAWWKKSYERYKADAAVAENSRRQFSTHFTYSAETANAKVTSAFGTITTESKALNKVCGDAYKKTLSTEVDFNYTNIESGSDEKYKLAADILRYCSPLIESPSILPSNDNTYANGTIGNQGHNQKLVQANTSANDVFWSIQHEWFKTQKNANPAMDEYFKTKLEDGKYLKDICHEAYGKTAVTGSSTKEAPTTNDVAKYCAFVKTS